MMKRLSFLFLLALLGALATPHPTAAQPLVREGQLRGDRVAVYADGRTLRLEVVGRGNVANPGTLAALSTTPFPTGAPAPNPVAAGPAWKVRVTAPGIQHLDAAALAAAGLDLTNPSALRLHHKGGEVALEEVRAPGGALTALRFYAEPGDRWNNDAVFWLTVGSGPGLRMVIRTDDPVGAPVTTTATELGVWRSNQIYDSRLPGPDGDHFFSADLVVVQAPEAPDAITATLAPRLPVAGAPTLTLAGETVNTGSFKLCVRGAPQPHGPAYKPCDDLAPDPNDRPITWNGRGLWAGEVTLPAFSPVVTVTNVPVPGADRVHLDSVSWAVPVRLELGERGASFVGQAGAAAYTLTAPPPDAAVYAITTSDATRPERLRLIGSMFEDNPPAARRYIVTGADTLHTPTIIAHTPVDLGRPFDAQAVYIAPSAFLEALGPLVEYRRAQGLTVAVVTTEAIYDTWGYGQADPEAIRSFLRYAAERWAVAPTTVILVGDGTSDPRNYLGRNNTNWVPPYLANVDFWLGETACESCYAQLHGADPRSDGLPDLAFGRIPAKSPTELAALVTKIMGYEQDPSIGLWRGTVAFVADNTDSGGDFLRAANESVALQPPGIRVARVAYDPNAPPDDPVRERDPLRALARSMGVFNNGAAIVHYVGHGLQFQWGYTGPPLNEGEPTDRQYLLGVFGADELRNGTRLPVVLSMTCLTGAFQIPAFSGTSIDERLVARSDGGAIAAWSSTGQGVLFGHESLQRGFYRALWAAPGRATLGELTLAGHLELFATQRCCQDAMRTYALLGDPLTAPRVRTDLQGVWLPVMER